MRQAIRVVAKRRQRHVWWRAAAALSSSALLVTGLAGTAHASDDVVGGARLGDSGVVVDPSSDVPALPPISATSFVIADADTGEVLAAQNAHEKLAPASTLKTLTAITLIPRLKPDVAMVAGRDAPSVDGTKAGIVAGTTYTAEALFTAMLMMSANDAAVALADMNGGLPSTLSQMNALAAHLQAYDTVAKTPNGLDAPGQSSSAYDLALIFRAGLANDRFRHYLALKNAPFPAPDGKTFQIQTHDKLLLTYPGIVGGKNGYTVAAQASYVGAATRGGHTIIVSVMRDQPNFWNEVKALLDWGFAADGLVDPVGTLVGPAKPTPPASNHRGGDAATGVTAPAPADAHAVPGAASGATAEGKKSDSTTGTIMTWAAVSIGGLIFVGALIAVAARRRKFRRVDQRYLAGLSRLSALERISDGS